MTYAHHSAEPAFHRWETVHLLVSAVRKAPNYDRKLVVGFIVQAEQRRLERLNCGEPEAHILAAIFDATIWQAADQIGGDAPTKLRRQLALSSADELERHACLLIETCDVPPILVTQRLRKLASGRAGRQAEFCRSLAEAVQKVCSRQGLA